MSQKREGEVPLSRITFEAMERHLKLRGLTWMDGGVSKQLLGGWRKKLKATAEADVQARVLARFARRTTMCVDNLRLTGESDRRLVSAALRELREANRLPVPPEQRTFNLSLLPDFRQLFGDARTHCDELDRAFENSTRIAIVRGPGGVAKSSLVGNWTNRIAGRLVDEPIRIFVWCFKGQDPQSSDILNCLLHWLGDEHCYAFSADAKARHIARRLATDPLRTAMVLDSFETMMSPNTATSGHIVSHSLQRLLFGLLDYDTAGKNLCVLTSRLSVDDLSHLVRSTPSRDGSAVERAVVEFSLGELAPEDGAEMLAHLGANRPHDELQELSRSMHGWPLALAVVGAKLREDPDCDPRRLLRLTRQRTFSGEAHFDQYMQWRVGTLIDPSQLQLLRLVACHEGAVRDDSLKGCVAAAGAIPEITDRLPMDDLEWDALLDFLQAASLLQVIATEAASESVQRGVGLRRIDMHQLVREWLVADLENRRPDLFRATCRLSLDGEYESSEPSTFADLAPYYRAARRLCRIDELNLAFFDVYLPKIARFDPVTGEGRFLSLQRFGAYESDQMLLRRFFTDDSLARFRPGLAEQAQGLIAGIVGFCLRANENLEAAMPLLTLSHRLLNAVGDRIHANSVAGYIAETLRTLGRLEDARQWATTSVRSADEICRGDRPGHRRQQIYHCTTLADIVRFQGDLEQSSRLFDEALSMTPDRRLSSIPSVRYCELLIDLEDFDAVQRQTAWVLGDETMQGEIVSVALHRLYAGYARSTTGNDSTARHAGLAMMQRAVADLDKAGFMESQALAHAWMARAQRNAGDLEHAEASADFGLRLSRTCGAVVMEVDCLCELSFVQLARRGRGLPAKISETRQALRMVEPCVTNEYRRKAHEVRELLEATAGVDE